MELYDKMYRYPAGYRESPYLNAMITQQGLPGPRRQVSVQDIAKDLASSYAQDYALDALLGSTGIGGGAAGTGGLSAASLAPAGPYAAAAAAAIAAGYNFNRNAKKSKTMGRGDALKEAAKDPMNYLIPTGFLGAAFGDRDMYLKEHRRLLGLEKDGVRVPKELLDNTRLERGRSKEALIKLEQDKINAGKYGNVEFARSRNESGLKPEDIWGYSAFFKKYGNDWLGKFSEQERRNIAQQALDRGAVREHHGTIDVDWNKVEATPKPAEATPAAAPQTKIGVSRPWSVEDIRKISGGIAATPAAPAPVAKPWSVNDIQTTYGRVTPEQSRKLGSKFGSVTAAFRR